MKIVICDIDGTIADGEHRVEHLRCEPKNWDAYFAAADLDTLRADILAQVKAHGAPVHLLTGRPARYEAQTAGWLAKHGVEYVSLVMRPDGDRRDDDVLKEELYLKHFSEYEIVAVYEDRPRIIRMWQRLGLPVVDVGNGIEF